MREYRKIFAGFLMGILGANLSVFRILFPKPKKNREKETYACALVCGYPAEMDGTISEILKSRVKKAVELWKDGKVTYLLLSGAAVANRFSEAEVMGAYARSEGIPEEYILLETRAVSTYHNFLYSRQIMEERNIRDCIVVTNGWHLRKANHYAQKFQLDYTMCACENSEGERRGRTVWRYLTTNIHMYYSFYKGLY